jgi:hypothetical protein
MGSVGDLQPRTSQSDMDVRPRRLAWNRMREGVERNLMGFEIAHQELPFLRLGVHCDVDAAAMVQTYGPMKLRFPISADRKRFVEPFGKSELDGLQLLGFIENAAAFVTLHPTHENAGLD